MSIGGTQALTLIDIDNTSTFNEAISATNINVADSITATAKKAITATAIVLDGGTLVLSDNNSVTIAGTINGSNTTEGTLQITGATKTFSGAIGTTQALTLIDVDNAAIFNGSIEATTLSVAASNYALELNGAANVITNAVTFSNTGALTLGDAILTVQPLMMVSRQLHQVVLLLQVLFKLQETRSQLVMEIPQSLLQQTL